MTSADFTGLLWLHKNRDWISAKKAMQQPKPKMQTVVTPRYAKGYNELGSYLGGVTENTLRKWVRMGMPVYMVDGVRLFKLSSIDAWLEQYLAGSTSEADGIRLDDILKEVNG
ncbi:helix-turn-helix domain-containing protein [Desulfoferrobacter suflitae]|uniref:helix-turn-helix domain-containing protein n=1 Tax=Desulfoferrobacter suflitae TaxID=2865782 RepID=UPI00216471A9|nr:helix-turn-helix domain-containing protein [Desulfoferrobacter suflitae]MCK8600154.1 helix-turn-helix domain-containing protein [Desulfoferrobacter suflitae]